MERLHGHHIDPALVSLDASHHTTHPQTLVPVMVVSGAPRLDFVDGGHTLSMMWVSAAAGSNHEQHAPDGEAAAHGEGAERERAVGTRPCNNSISERSASAVWWRTREECMWTAEVKYGGRVNCATEECHSEV